MTREDFDDAVLDAADAAGLPGADIVRACRDKRKVARGTWTTGDGCLCPLAYAGYVNLDMLVVRGEVPAAFTIPVAQARQFTDAFDEATAEWGSVVSIVG